MLKSIKIKLKIEVVLNMKKQFFLKRILILIFMFLFMILVPLLALKGGCKTIRPNNQSRDIKVGDVKSENSRFFKVMDQSNGEIINIKDEDFLIGVVASEMPAKFNSEALKAQAVASYTYFSRQREKSRENGKNDFDFTVNTQKGINYITEEKMRNNWGDNFNSYYGKIKNCVDSVYGEVLKEDGELILAVYHAISSGKTEKSVDVFGGECKYLTNVCSPGDKSAPGYETVVKVDLEKFKYVLSSKFGNCNFDGNPENWVGSIERTEAGTVRKINICSHDFKGTEVRTMFALRSSNFDISFSKEDNKFVFTVRGYGHGVGMSQRGAEAMALEGNDYKKILSWYYPGTTTEKIF